MSFMSYNLLVKFFKNIKWIATDLIIENIAAIKDQYEIDSLKTAVEITDLVFTKILEHIKPGVNEKYISAKISYLFKTNGADGDSYESISYLFKTKGADGVGLDLPFHMLGLQIENLKKVIL